MRAPRRTTCYWLVFAACAAYFFGFAAFPMGHFKGDGTSLATGARQILEQGWTARESITDVKPVPASFGR